MGAARGYRVLKFHPGFLAGKGAVSIYRRIVNLGLDSALGTCLDFGISETYSATAQAINDLSPAGGNFYMGVDTGATFDPTFHGTAGDGTANEYMTFGPIGIMLARTFNFWQDNLHKAGASFTIMAVAENNGLDSTLITTNDASNTAIGVYAFLNGSSTVLRVANGSALSLNVESTITAPLGLNIIFISASENGGAAASHWRINSNTETFNAHYTSPSASPASVYPKLGQGSQSNFKMAAFALWTSALTTTDTGNIYDAIKVRWGL